jgi:organic hydroperoxide reductase OsmC/OhrA
MSTSSMQISARVSNSGSQHTVIVDTDGSYKTLPISGRPFGGSAISGGELLMLALATCYCNDLYREAAKRNIHIEEVHVEAQAEFPGVGLAAKNIRYSARIKADGDSDALAALIRDTDAVAEIQNTLRAGVDVELDLG